MTMKEYYTDCSKTAVGLRYLHRTGHGHCLRAQVAAVRVGRLFERKVSFMKKNMGLIDRLLRTALAIVVAVLYFAGQLTGTAAVILGVLAVIFLVTSATGFCPVYTWLGISTLKGGEHEGGPHGEAHRGAR
jgi:hypothetical protein